MPSPDYLRAAAICDEGDTWRSTLTPEAYAEWKVWNVELHLDHKVPKWREGIHPEAVEQEVIGEWFADDCVALPAVLRAGIEVYPFHCIQLNLARPWLAGQAYLTAFGNAMSPKWKDKLQTFINDHQKAVEEVITTDEAGLLEKLRAEARKFLVDVKNFRLSYGEFVEL